MKGLFCILPGVAGCAVIWRTGLPGVAVLLILEIVLLVLWREGRQHDGMILLFSTLGIGTGYALCPMISVPTALGIGSLLTTMVVHAAVFLIIAGLLKNK